MNESLSVAERLETVKSGLPEGVELVAVSKTIENDRILEAYESGQKHFAENRVQDFVLKTQELPKDIQWHFVGRLQTNKVKALLEACGKLELMPLLQSLDRLALAEEIQKQAERLNVERVPALVQVNCSGEDSKAGFDLEEVFDFVSNLDKFPVINIQGLMTIGPHVDDVETIRRDFSLTRECCQNLQEKYPDISLQTLSMGMSNDYPLAIEQGSNMVRVGTAIFGPREK